MELAGHAYDLDLVGTTLNGLVTLHVPVPRPRQQGVSAGPNVALLVYYDSRTGRWQPVNASYNPGTGTLTATSSHLSIWSALRPDPAQILAAATSTLKGFLGIADTAQPPCPNGSQLPTVGINVTADPGDLVSWCPDYNGTSAVIRVASNRTYAMEANYLSDWSMNRVGNLDPVTAQILKYLPALSLRVSGPNVRTVIIPGGQEVDLTPPARASGIVLIGPTAEGILVDAMLYAADTLAMTFGKIPGAAGPDPSKTAKAVGLAFDSGKCVNEMLAVGHNPDVTTPQAAGGVFRSFTDVAASCLADTWTAAYDISGFMAPFYVGTLLWLADGIKLITTDLHSLIDSFMYWQGYHIYYRSTAPAGLGPGVYQVNRQFYNDGSLILSLDRVQISQQGKAVFYVTYSNIGSSPQALTCQGGSDPALATLALANGEVINSIVSYCSDHPDLQSISVLPGHTLTSYAIFASTKGLARPFSFSWSSSSLSGTVPGVQLANPSPASTTSPLTGTWTGSYFCAQGKTGLRLAVQATPDGTLTATFNFYAVPDNPGVPSGSFTMTGTYSDAGVDLTHDHWISQPPGYLMVDLSAGPPTQGGTALSGNVSGPAPDCTTFTVTKTGSAE